MKTTKRTVLMACAIILITIVVKQAKSSNLKKDNSSIVSFSSKSFINKDAVISGYACISNVNITLDELSCSRQVAPHEVITGNTNNVDAYIISIDGQNTDVVSGCGEHSYSIDVIENGVVVYTCGGHLFAEDKSPPIINCPSDISQLLLDNGTAAPVLFDLRCNDIDSLLIIGEEIYTVDSNGDTIAGSLSANLRRILNKTAYPDITDNCGPVKVSVSDEIIGTGDCNNLTILRHFRISDHFGGDCDGEAYVNECQQRIYFRKTTMADVVRPDSTVALACNEAFLTDGILGGPDENPSALVTGIPFVRTAFGVFNLAESYCNIGASYSDEPRIIICDGSYTIRREWNLIDGCDAGSFVVFDQIIAVKDTIGPKITLPIPDYDGDGYPDSVLHYSTSPFNCQANYTIPQAMVEDANACSSITTRNVIIFDHNDDFIWTGAEETVVALDTGIYRMQYCIQDACANETCQSWMLKINDRIAPTAVCNETLIVSIGGGDVQQGIEGNARILAEAVNQASSDNCGLISLEIRRNHWLNESCHIDQNRWSYWDDYVDFYCCDIGKTIKIELRATDETGNWNTCWLNIVPEDKLVPYCYPPEAVTLSCLELPQTFPGDIQQAYIDDFTDTSEMMNALFGRAVGSDNCAVDTIVERTPQININDCGWGIINRRFEIWQLKPTGDINENGRIDLDEVWSSTNNCSQQINITETHSYRIDFPQDASASCEDPCIWDIFVEKTGCDILAVNRGEPERYVVAGEECYQLRIIYDVINWCQWDGEYEGYTIIRLTEDEDEDLDIDKAVESTERPVIIGDDSGVILDRNHPRRTICMDGSRGYDPDDDSFLRDTTDVDIPDLNRGRWNYTQFVNVFDTIPPVIHVGEYGGPTELCPDLDNGQFGEPYGTCVVSVSIPFSVTDSCELFDSEGVLVVSLVSAEIDLFAVDANYDNVISQNELFTEADVLDSIVQNGDGSYVLTGDYPVIGPFASKRPRHAVQLVFEDGCGNTSSTIIQFGIVDCKPTAPICIHGLTVTLLPDGSGGCSGRIWAADFEASPVYDCTGQGPETHPETGQFRITQYAIFRATEVDNNENFVPFRSRKSLLFTEEDLENEIIPVYVYTFDNYGNYDYCETYVVVEAHEACNQETALLSGKVITETNRPVKDVAININNNGVVLTDTEGNYTASVFNGSNYMLSPYFNDDFLNGVTTFDLVLISKHILGVQLLDSPYKLIAADVNQSNAITTLDLIQIRKLILNIIPVLEDNTSWRFIDASYDFSLESNPWDSAFPEYMNLNNVDQSYSNANFIGIKIGDVNGSVTLD